MIIIPIILLTLIVTTLSYFDFLNKNINNYLKIVIPIISVLIGGFYLGKRSKEKGWLEGLKLGGIFLLLLFIFSYLGFQKSFRLKDIIYYLILLVSSILGSMIGINKKKVTN